VTQALVRHEGSTLAPRTLDDVVRLAEVMLASRLLPEGLRTVEQVAVVVMYGMELGLSPMQSVRLIHVIKGKPCPSADLVGSLAVQTPACEYLTLVESTPERATYEAKRRGSPKVVTMSFTLAEAKAAGLAGKEVWRQYPAAMLRARALVAICRATFPEAVAGLHIPDEIEDSAPQASALPSSPPPAPEASAPGVPPFVERMRGDADARVRDIVARLETIAVLPTGSVPSAEYLEGEEAALGGLATEAQALGLADGSAGRVLARTAYRDAVSRLKMLRAQTEAA
jgi:hypothetical protein